jgi:hypothetical protein
MFESWTDVVAALGTALAVAYVGYEIARRQRELRELFQVLAGKDRAITARLEQMVDAGLLKPIAGASPA